MHLKIKALETSMLTDFCHQLCLLAGIGSLANDEP